MRSIFTLTKRELGVYFISPMAYIIMTAYLVITGYFFYANVEFLSSNRLPARYEDTIGIIVSLTIFMMPLITMRLIAEEKNKGTIETLLTVPITEFQVVFSKYFAAMLFYILLLLPSLLYVMLLGMYAHLDYGEIIGGYISLILLSSALLSIGIFISSLCTNQISAGVITLVISILILSVNIITHSIKDKGALLREILDYLNFPGHIVLLMKGIIDTKDVIFMLSVAVLFIFLTVRVIESRRWK